MSSLEIRSFEKSDHAEWRRLWTAYLEFYESTVPEEVYETTWRRLFTEGEFEPKGFVAILDGKAVGLTHYMFHRSAWLVENKCYLQDLFADPEIRGKGIGAALIAAVKEASTAKGCAGIYWLTHETNATARKLYDRVATNTGFIRYSQP
jgi:GNAT superfamily N-acetyltransferase